MKFKFFKTTFGKILLATTAAVAFALAVSGYFSFRQINTGLERYIQKEWEFFQGRGMFIQEMIHREQEKQLQVIEYEFKTTVSRSIIVSSLFGLSAGIILSAIISEQITKPLAKLKNVIRKVSQNDYKSRAEVEGSEEIQELITEFNKLIDELDRIETLREELVSDVAHELKTPMTKIRGNLEGFVDGVYKLNKTNVNKILGNVGQLEYLVDQLQKLTQLRSGKYALNMREINVKNAVKNILAGHEKDGIEVIIEIEDGFKVKADKNKFTEIMDNLIGNAFKYTDKGFVKITANDAGITVKDSGIGIPKKDLPYIFERFYRVDKSRNKETGGLGLGLAIVKELVEAHGWEIEVESKVGKGSEFRIDLQQPI